MKVNGLMHVIRHVYYVPELKNNLLSIGQLRTSEFKATLVPLHILRKEYYVKSQ